MSGNLFVVFVLAVVVIVLAYVFFAGSASGAGQAIAALQSALNDPIAYAKLMGEK